MQIPFGPQAQCWHQVSGGTEQSPPHDAPYLELRIQGVGEPLQWAWLNAEAALVQMYSLQEECSVSICAPPPQHVYWTEITGDLPSRARHMVECIPPLFIRLPVVPAWDRCSGRESQASVVREASFHEDFIQSNWIIVQLKLLYLYVWTQYACWAKSPHSKDVPSVTTDTALESFTLF